MSRTSAGEVIRAHLGAFNSHDLPALLATMAPDAVFVIGTTLVAPKDFEDFFGWAMREIDPTTKITNLIVYGESVACEFVGSFTLDGLRQHRNRAAFYAMNGDVLSRRRFTTKPTNPG
jgi:ketosteroid isomerase-like protein